MEVHAVRAEIGELVHGVDRIERRARLVCRTGSRPRFPTVHRPNVNWSVGCGS